MKFVHLNLLVLALICTVPTVASAQWQWIDSAGKKVFSDQSPPPDIPEKNIVRRPSGGAPRVSFSQGTPAAPDAAAPGVAPAAPAPAIAASGARPSGVDKELEEKTKKAEDAEKAKRAAELQKMTQAKAENCNRARQSKATFDSGIRVARLNAQGEREIIDDKARAEEQQRLQTVIASDCK
ncbi:MAG: hypothetical protein JWQ73_224 [Variovorax sp.]|nr:hypothetical protein [Variovorax sp.]